MPEQMQDNPIYKFMKANDLTKLDEKTFLDKYSAPEKAKEIHSFMVSNKLTELDDAKFYDKYLKKKDQQENLPSVSSPTKSQSDLPDFKKGKAFAEKGFLMQAEGTKSPKEIEIEPVEKQGLLLNTVSSLDKAFAKGFSSPVKALGTALQGATKKVMGGTGEGYVSDALIKFGDYLNNAIDELTPQDEEFKGTLTDQVAQAFGQVGSLVLTGGLTGAGKGAAALVSQAPKGAAATAKALGSQLANPTAVSAGLSMGQAEFDRALEAGATDDQAFEAFYKNASVGSVLETIPVMQFFKRFNNSTGGSVANYIKTKGVAGFTGGIEEMTTEVMQQLYSNKTAKDIYNINQDILDGVGTSGGIGFGVGFLLNAMGANAKILRKQGREQEATVLENQVKQYEDNLEKPKVTSDKKAVTKDIVTQGVDIGTQKAVKSLDRDLANNVITPEQYQEGIVFTEKAAQVVDKIPETVTGESKVKSVELLVERNDIKQANQSLLEQKQTTDEAYHAGIDQEIKANEEKIKKLDTEVYNIAKSPSKEFGTKKYVVDGEEVSKEYFEALQGKPLGAKTVIKADATQKTIPVIDERGEVEFPYNVPVSDERTFITRKDYEAEIKKPTKLKPTEVKTASLEEEYDSKNVDELIALKKKLYPSPDIESPMTPEEKLLDRVIAKKFSEKQQEIISKRKTAAESVEGSKVYNAKDLKANPEVLKSDKDYLGNTLPKNFDTLYTDVFTLKNRGYENKKSGDVINIFKKDYVIEYISENKKNQNKATVKLIQVDKEGNLLRNKDLSKKEQKEGKAKEFEEEEVEVEVAEELTKDDLKKAEAKFAAAEDKFKKARNKIEATQVKQAGMFGGEQKGMFAMGGAEAKSTLDPLRKAAKEAKAELDNLRNRLKVQEVAQPELAPVEKSKEKTIRKKEDEVSADYYKTFPIGKIKDGSIAISTGDTYSTFKIEFKRQGKQTASPETVNQIKKWAESKGLEYIGTSKEDIRETVNFKLPFESEAPKKTYQEAVKEKLEADKKRNREAGAERATVTKEVYRRVNQMDAPADAEQVALRYLADGGTVSKEAVDEAYGSVKRAELNVKRRVSLSEEVKSKDFVQGNETLDDLAHRLWEANNQKIPEDKIKDKLMAEIGNNNSRLEAAEAYLDKYNAEYKQEKEELRLSEQYKEQYLEEQAEIEKELRKPLDEQIEGEASEEHINNLINQYEAEIKGQDQQLRPESEGDVSKEAGKGKVAEKTSETELAKEYKEATGKASKKAKENAKKDFVERNFDNIVEKLKIQIKCPT